MQLAGRVDPEQSSWVKRSPSRLQIVLMKTEREFWQYLLQGGYRDHALYHVSTDWDRWMDEDDSSDSDRSESQDSVLSNAVQCVPIKDTFSNINLVTAIMRQLPPAWIWVGRSMMACAIMQSAACSTQGEDIDLCEGLSYAAHCRDPRQSLIASTSNHSLCKMLGIVNGRSNFQLKSTLCFEETTDGCGLNWNA